MILAIILMELSVQPCRTAISCGSHISWMANQSFSSSIFIFLLVKVGPDSEESGRVLTDWLLVADELAPLVPRAILLGAMADDCVVTRVGRRLHYPYPNPPDSFRYRTRSVWVRTRS